MSRWDCKVLCRPRAASSMRIVLFATQTVKQSVPIFRPAATTRTHRLSSQADYWTSSGPSLVEWLFSLLHLLLGPNRAILTKGKPPHCSISFTGRFYLMSGVQSEDTWGRPTDLSFLFFFFPRSCLLLPWQSHIHI